ncbi:hypothetical protein HAX54_003903 [Datura stramonium]|uniref:Bifunctional inhibitor/plant lipid transfer protein/seed storage helical domain-containing protein n=1 Tax=Datura stramonium TaxID=4076 RepID=A0ABS8T766_DATST|nr:hypothetical protein [Datura stramonium]
MAVKKNLLAFVAIIRIISPCYYASRSEFVDDPICDEVHAGFAYCEVYVDGIASNPTRECCDNLLALNVRVKYEHSGVRRYCCCIESFCSSHLHPPYLQSRILNMTEICGIHLSFPISERMDCSESWRFSPERTYTANSRLNLVHLGVAVLPTFLGN